MQKINFILLIIILVITAIVTFGFLYFRNMNNPKENENTGDINFVSEFNPLSGGASKPPITKPPTDVSGYVPPIENISMLKLAKVSTMPVAGFTVFNKERFKLVVSSNPPSSEPIIDSKKSTKKPTPGATETVPALRYVTKANGNIYQTFADKIKEEKFSKTMIPKVYDSYFGNRGGSVTMRYLKGDDQTIETFVGTLPKELLGANPNTENEIKGSFLPNNIKDISLSPDTAKMFYLFNSGDDMVGATLKFTDNKKAQIFDSPFTEWLSWWPNNNIITLTTKPSANIPGYMYSMDSSGKNLSKVLGDINGLTTLESPNGKLVLYGDNNLVLSVYHTDTRNSDALSIKTLPEKCVWGTKSDIAYCAVPKSFDAGAYPDSWYQGEVSFNDQIWKIDIKTGNATIVIDPVTIQGGEEIDGIKLALDENQNYLFFVNKKDNFLWKLDLK